MEETKCAHIHRECSTAENFAVDLRLSIRGLVYCDDSILEMELLHLVNKYLYRNSTYMLSHILPHSRALLSALVLLLKHPRTLRTIMKKDRDGETRRFSDVEDLINRNMELSVRIKFIDFSNCFLVIMGKYNSVHSMP